VWRIAADLGPAPTALEPPDTGKIDDSDRESVKRAIVGMAPGTRPMLDRQGANGAAVPKEQSRKKAMHMIKLRKSEEILPSEDFEAAACVGGVVAEQPRTNRVGEA
jgi:hypothetical protein